VTGIKAINNSLRELAVAAFGPLDLLPQDSLAEKLIGLELHGVPAGPPRLTSGLAALADRLAGLDTRDTEVVVFGGGTGLSNVIGGDSRNPTWPRDPFRGMKEIFPRTRSIVCVTDDGGSTGELLRDFPLIALGDLRHVLLSSVQQARLQRVYGLDAQGAALVVRVLHDLFNYRFTARPDNVATLLAQARCDMAALPAAMGQGLGDLLARLFTDQRFEPALGRPHCLGNLLLAMAIYREVEQGLAVSGAAILAGIDWLAELIGSYAGAVLPCTTTPACFKALYANGVLATGENRSASARRGYPIERVFVEFVDAPQVPEAVLAAIARARIIVFAPGSLFTSIVPILQVPGIAEAVRKNTDALKILVSNLWIQKGETDLVRDDPRRRFYVSDLVKAYHRNIPGGVRGLFDAMLVLSLQDIPGNVLQNYALENKVPIFFDKEKVQALGCNPVEAGIFSHDALTERQVIQHDPGFLARAVRTVWACRDHLPGREKSALPVGCEPAPPLIKRDHETPNRRMHGMIERLAGLRMTDTAREQVTEVLWQHWDIPLGHLAFFDGVELVAVADWPRSQEWDNIFSFYEPESRLIKIRDDISQRPYYFELAFLVGLGQSLLGNYAALKAMQPLETAGEQLGSLYRITLCPPDRRRCFFNEVELRRYLCLARMKQSDAEPHSFTRVVNGDEGFTPPGLFFGLTYAWYLDNRFASHIEYKMSIFRMGISELIPYQATMYHRRRELVDFFRQVVFGHDEAAYAAGLGDQRQLPQA